MASKKDPSPYDVSVNKAFALLCAERKQEHRDDDAFLCLFNDYLRGIGEQALSAEDLRALEGGDAMRPVVEAYMSFAGLTVVVSDHRRQKKPQQQRTRSVKRDVVEELLSAIRATPQDRAPERASAYISFPDDNGEPRRIYISGRHLSTIAWMELRSWFIRALSEELLTAEREAREKKRSRMMRTMDIGLQHNTEQP